VQGQVTQYGYYRCTHGAPQVRTNINTGVATYARTCVCSGERGVLPGVGDAEVAGEGGGGGAGGRVGVRHHQGR
jgi:hypothetical protein